MLSMYTCTYMCGWRGDWTYIPTYVRMYVCTYIHTYVCGLLCACMHSIYIRTYVLYVRICISAYILQLLHMNMLHVVLIM